MTCFRLISFFAILALITGICWARNFTLHLDGGSFNVNGSLTAGNYTAGKFCKITKEGDVEANGTLSVSSNATGFYYNGTNSVGYFTNSSDEKVYFFLETIGGFTYSGSPL